MSPTVYRNTRHNRMVVRAIKHHSLNARLGLFHPDPEQKPLDFCKCGSQKKYKECCGRG